MLDKIKKVESQFVDALYNIKNRLSEGHPFEDAVSFAAEHSGYEVSQLLSKISRLIKRRSLSLEQAVKECKISSNLIKSSFELILTSLKNGREAAAQTCSVLHDYLSKIKEAERSLVQLLQKNLVMMKAAVTFFSPIVCAIIVILFEMVTKNISEAQVFFTATTINPQILQLIVGLYAIALNFVLIRYISKIQYGEDAISFKLELAKSIPAVIFIYTACLLALKFLLL